MVTHKDEDRAFYSFPYFSLPFIICIIQLFIFVVVFLSYRRKKAKTENIPGYKSNDISQLCVLLNMAVKRKGFSHGVAFLQLFNALAYCSRKEGMAILLPSIKPLLFLHKAEYVEVVLNGKNFEKGFEYHFLKDWFKDGIFGKDVEKWRYARKISKPAFHTRLLDEAMVIVNEKAKLLNEKLDSAMKSNQHVDIVLMLEICTLDIICEAGMGLKRNEKYIADFNTAWKKYKALTIKRICIPWLWPDVIYFNTKQGKEANRCMKPLEKFVRELVAEKKSERLSQMENIKNTSKNIDDHGTTREGKNEKNSTILDVLLSHHFLNENFTQEDVAKEINVFLVGGSDTVAASTSWAIYMLGLYPDAQQKVHEELDRVLGEDTDKEITREDVKKLIYLECVMKEARRLFPPIPFSGRVLEEDTLIGTYLVPKGTTCLINIYMLHRNPDVFPNPEAFYPERFLENTKRHPCAFIPFLAGPRNCIGQSFGALETIILVASVLRRFEIKSLIPLDKIFISMDLSLNTDNELLMTFLDRRRD